MRQTDRCYYYPVATSLSPQFFLVSYAGSLAAPDILLHKPVYAPLSQALIAAVIDGSINVISSDHSPAPPGLKQMESGDFLKAWGGISGLQYLLPATWTAISSAGGDLPLLSRVLSSGPAKVAGLQDTKGQIAEGMDADLLVRLKVVGDLLYNWIHVRSHLPTGLVPGRGSRHKHEGQHAQA